VASRDNWICAERSLVMSQNSSALPMLSPQPSRQLLALTALLRPVQGHFAEHGVRFAAGAVPELGQVGIAQHLLQQLSRDLGAFDAEHALGGAVHPGDAAGGVGHDHADAHAVERLADEAAIEADVVEGAGALLHAAANVRARGPCTTQPKGGAAGRMVLGRTAAIAPVGARPAAAAMANHRGRIELPSRPLRR
jgi:hypothetical protein